MCAAQAGADTLGVQQVVAAAEAGAEFPRHPLCPCERELLQADVIGDTATCITQLLHCYMYQLLTSYLCPCERELLQADLRLCHTCGAWTEQCTEGKVHGVAMHHV